jgi:molecular chaperone GrpE
VSGVAPGGLGGPRNPDEPIGEGVKVTDRRRVDPETGRLRPGAAPPAAQPAGQTGSPGDGPDDAGPDAFVGQSPDAVAEALTADLQRVSAEYANYRRRVERDREAAREQGTAIVFAELLAVLDDVGRAREHDELDGAFKAVGERLEAATARLGLERYGEPGDPFDPTIHEALTHEHRDDVDEPTCVTIFQPGYRFAGRVLRPARVAVAEPE